MLGELLARCTQPQFTYTHRWRPGDPVMWHDHCVLHRAQDNDDMGRFPRVLHGQSLQRPILSIGAGAGW